MSANSDPTVSTPRPEVKDAAFGRALPEDSPDDEPGPRRGWGPSLLVIAIRMPNRGNAL